jgi:hypothetical protein
VRTDDLIVELARNASPVAPLASPSVRFARWAAVMFLFAAVGVFVLGPRPDIAEALRQAAYVARLVITLLTAVLAAVAAFVLSVPGAERTKAQRIMPFVAVCAWTALLGTFLIAGGDPVARVIAFPVNWPCGYKILGFSIVPGFVLFALLRRAAPLEPVWNASLAALAATALGAAATQFICPVDDPAHQLVGHVLPVVVLAAAGTIAGYQSLRKNWF